MQLNIVTVPNKILRQKSKPISTFDTKLSEFITDLSDTLTQSEVPGVGISAIQVGKPIRLFLTYFPEKLDLPLKKWSKAKANIQAYINPEIIAHSDDIYLGDDKGDSQMEGCLSIPKVWGHVWRYTWIDLKFQDSKSGKIITQRYTGFPGRVIQHEFDHLNGILFTDHILNKTGLKVHSNHLFFDVDDQFLPIQNPVSFAQW